MQLLSWRYHETLASLEEMSIDDFDSLYNWMVEVQKAEAAATETKK